ncbi:GNAT family N-acetyltransferase [Parablautia intestinalis]|jgi:ribosomal protein S18 acetylase RimI-like enzyme|uniref:GNAT family N-acetyltransferase n=1 Tax=Parablautia intestinalis TaxID=2320100 RepID=A0A3A9AHJ0_9FIRM|nr:GNAT family N-acetyltransferase [Parablautia intestinalis]MCI8613718.1 GNAT family N-acetyltransferase [Lachnospiraceae bacterium]RKI91090.1 GNAT family N-acetyltransferase [Parablautia intestinalis]
MVRLAAGEDAPQLEILNNEFNGVGVSHKYIKQSLLSNEREIVVVDEEDGIIAGFVCVQLKKSFCYEEYMPEITEVYVSQAYRRKGIASKMIMFAEKFITDHYLLGAVPFRIEFAEVKPCGMARLNHALL